MNAGLDTGRIQKIRGAGSVPGPNFEEYLASLVETYLKKNPLDPPLAGAPLDADLCQNVSALFWRLSSLLFNVH